MLYGLFLFIAIAYNIRKYSREREAFLASLTGAAEISHRNMILSHSFHVYIFESFLSIIVAHFITEGSLEMNLAGIGIVYLCLMGVGLIIFQSFVKHVERATGLELRNSFNQHLIKEFRVSFALIMLPMVLYSVINWAFDDSMAGWGNWWIIGMFSNIIFVSVVTILCTVIIMLQLIPNREITEPEYLTVINHRLAQIGTPHMRVRWIESDIKNAFVVGLKLLRFSNQTMFVGKSLRTMLTIEEFDAIIAHELSHVANRHIQKRVIDLLKNFISGIFGLFLIFVTAMGSIGLYYGEEMILHLGGSLAFVSVLALAWFVFNYALFFDVIRSHEYEADAYAVMELGASLEAYQSALEKLTKHELPEYLKHKMKVGRKPSWALKAFSTHPSIEERINSLQWKIASGLPFNHYVSTAQKFRSSLGLLLQWKVSVPLFAGVVAVATQLFFSIKEGQGLIALIKEGPSEKIMANDNVLKRINDRPLIIGPTLLHEVVLKNDLELLNYYVKNGANKSKVLYYLAEYKNQQLFARFYPSFQKDLTEDEYFLVLRNAAEAGFNEGYRLMVNSTKFDDLTPEYKADLTRIHQKRRAPASTEEK